MLREEQDNINRTVTCSLNSTQTRQTIRLSMTLSSDAYITQSEHKRENVLVHTLMQKRMSTKLREPIAFSPRQYMQRITVFFDTVINLTNSAVLCTYKENV